MKKIIFFILFFILIFIKCDYDVNEAQITCSYKGWNKYHCVFLKLLKYLINYYFKIIYNKNSFILLLPNLLCICILFLILYHFHSYIFFV